MNAGRFGEQVVDGRQRARGVAGAADERSREFLWKVHGWMSLGLGITGLIGLGLAGAALTSTGQVTPMGQLLLNPIVRFGSLIVALILVFALSGLQHRIGPTAAAALFLVYAAINGIWTSVVFLSFTAESIGVTFLVTGGTFAATSLFGYITKRDLSGLGTFAFMGLIGVIIASVVNLFLASPLLYWLITYAGIAVFVGLTAWDTQKIKEIGAAGLGERESKQAAIQGALALYLDFLNLFLLLLNLFGSRE